MAESIGPPWSSASALVAIGPPSSPSARLSTQLSISGAYWSEWRDRRLRIVSGRHGGHRRQRSPPRLPVARLDPGLFDNSRRQTDSRTTGGRPPEPTTARRDTFPGPTSAAAGHSRRTGPWRSVSPVDSVRGGRAWLSETYKSRPVPIGAAHLGRRTANPPTGPIDGNAGYLRC
jgi:hypothetical protein